MLLLVLVLDLVLILILTSVLILTFVGIRPFILILVLSQVLPLGLFRVLSVLPSAHLGLVNLSVLRVRFLLCPNRTLGQVWIPQTKKLWLFLCRSRWRVTSWRFFELVRRIVQRRTSSFRCPERIATVKHLQGMHFSR